MASTAATTVSLSRPRAAHGLRRLLRSRSAVLGLTLALLVLVPTLFASVVAPYGATDSVAPALQPPSLRHIMGTDDLGRDVFSRVLYGGRVSLQMGLGAAATAGLLGLLLGALAGYLGGWTDEIVMRAVDVKLAFPGILLATAVVATLGPGSLHLTLAVGIGMTGTVCRVVRASVLSATAMDYVAAARAVGQSSRGIVVRHIIPNISAGFIVLATLQIAEGILIATGLSYLGLGTRPPAPEWGRMLADAHGYVAQAWWTVTFPGLAITATAAGVNTLGDALRDVFDPRLRDARA